MSTEEDEQAIRKMARELAESTSKLPLQPLRWSFEMLRETLRAGEESAGYVAGVHLKDLSDDEFVTELSKDGAIKDLCTLSGEKNEAIATAILTRFSAMDNSMDGRIAAVLNTEGALEGLRCGDIRTLLTVVARPEVRETLKLALREPMSPSNFLSDENDEEYTRLASAPGILIKNSMDGAELAGDILSRLAKLSKQNAIAILNSEGGTIEILNDRQPRQFIQFLVNRQEVLESLVANESPKAPSSPPPSNRRGPRP